MTAKKPPEEHKKDGRPAKYKIEYNEQGRKLCLLGHTDKQLADFFQVDVSTVNRWKIDYPEFQEALKKGKVVADANVAASLYNRAVGYSHPEDKIFQYEGSPVIVPTVKHYPPDPIAQKVWLYNRRRGDWKDKQTVDHNVKDVTIRFDKEDEGLL